MPKNHSAQDARTRKASGQVAALSLCLYASGEDVYVPEVHPDHAELKPTAVVFDDADLVSGLAPRALAAWASAGLFVLVSLPKRQAFIDRFAGATFDILEPNEPYSFSASDLLAVSLLDVPFRPRAVRGLLDTQRFEFEELLVLVPADVALWEVDGDQLQPAYALWKEVRTLDGVGPRGPAN